MRPSGSRRGRWGCLCCGILLLWRGSLCRCRAQAVSASRRLATEPTSLSEAAAVPVSSGNNATAPPEPCLLQCANGGECRIASADPSAADDRRGHYCYCPVGFTGAACEIRFVTCGGADDTCFNGAPCRRDVADGGAVYYRCECDTDPTVSDLASAYAGRFCERAATTYCDDGGDGSGHRGDDAFFCSSSGRCRADRKSCSCPPQWTGDHCQIPVNLKDLYKKAGFLSDQPEQEQPQAPPASSGDTRTPDRVARVSLAIILATLVAAIIVMRRYGVELSFRYGPIEQPPEPGSTGNQRRRRKPHPMEMEMKHMRAPQQQSAPRNEVV